MKLYFLRHGIAADTGSAGTGDAGRPLTQEGIEKMEAEARGLARLGVRLEVLLSSPLVRARQTAEIVARALRVEVQLADALAFGSDTRELLDLLGQHQRAESVMVVGHEPFFSRMIGDLTGGSQVVLKKGGLGRVDLDVLERGGGALVWLLPPKILVEIGR